MVQNALPSSETVFDQPALQSLYYASLHVYNEKTTTGPPGRPYRLFTSGNFGPEHGPSLPRNLLRRKSGKEKSELVRKRSVCSLCQSMPAHATIIMVHFNICYARGSACFVITQLLILQPSSQHLQTRFQYTIPGLISQPVTCGLVLHPPAKKEML